MKKYKMLSALLAASLIIQPFAAMRAAAAPAQSSEKEDSTEKDSSAGDNTGKNTETTEEETVPTETIEINTVEDFIKFAADCHLDSWSVNKVISLKKDLDLSGAAFETIPVFAGTFDGNGHTISGFQPGEQGYIVGLFRYIQPGGTVKNLTVQGNVNAANEQECIGGICGINYGTIRTCSFRGIVSGQNTVGGIAGINEVSGVITNCLSDGRITGFHSTGGIVGSNHGLVAFCSNSAGINDNSDWVEEDDEQGTGLFFSFQASEDEIDLYSGVDTGGIAGYSDGDIECCDNSGIIGYEHTGYNIGGIAGRQAGLLRLCTNNGKIYGRKDVGGIVGQMEPDIEVDEAQSLRNAVNKLHDLIEKTLDDMHDTKNVLKSDLDDLSAYGDGALSSGDAMIGQMTNFIDDNMEQTQAMANRIDYIMDMLPDILDDVSASGDAFGRMSDALRELPDDLDFMSSVDGSYDETDYNRISLLSTVGGQIFSNSINPAEGESVMITVAPDEGYKLQKLSVTDADGNTIVSDDPAGTEESYTFVMPATNVRAEAYFQVNTDSPVWTSLSLFSYDSEETGETEETFEQYVETIPDNISENAFPPAGEEPDPQTNGSLAPLPPIATIPEGEDGNTSTSPDNVVEGDETNSSPDTTTEGDETNSSPDTTTEGDETGSSPDTTTEGDETNSSPDTTTKGDETSEPIPAAPKAFSLPRLPLPASAPLAGSDKKVMLSSNLSGSASCEVDKNGNTATLTVIPDTAYTLSGTPTVTDNTGKTLDVTRVSNGSYRYDIDISDAESPITAEIDFAKLNQNDTLSTSSGNIQASIGDLQQNAVRAEACIQHINELMAGQKWSDITDSTIKNQIFDEIIALYGYMNDMSASSYSILSGFGTISNVLAPYIQDAAEDALDDIEQAADELHNMINSLKEAGRGVRVIVDYLNGQPDIQFATLGPEFDAEREDLHIQLMGISDALKSLSNNASDYSDIVNEDLKAVNDQLNVVFNLLADRLTDSQDASVEELYEEADTEDIENIFTGRVDSSINNGIVKGDINIGGITGSMSIDEEDPEDSAAGSVDYEIGSHFITKCIVSDSVNNGYITAKKDGAGGIVGYMRHGIVTDCEGYGNIESTEGDYVGGIAGESLTVIRNCYALCSVSGARDVGGVAGYANTLQDCYAIVSTEATAGRVGAIAGEISDDTDGVVSGNYYVGDDVYGIDNISYAQMAAPIAYNDLLATAEYLPTEFWHLKVTYRVDDTYLGTEEVKYGASLANLHYPEIPAKDGFYGSWPDLSDQVMKGNLLIDGCYMDTVTVVESSEKAETEDAGDDWQKPYALVEQTFTEDTVLNAGLSDREGPQEAENKPHVIYDVSLENSGIGDKDTFAVRLLNPYGEKVQVYGLTDGEWHELESKVRGQYLQVDMTGPQESFCIVNTKTDALLIAVIAVAVIAGAAVVFLFIRMSKRINGKIAARIRRRGGES